MKNTSILFLLIAFVLGLTGCRKISTPDEASREIFGKWEYKSDSGGFSGDGGSSTFKENSWVEFSEKGVYKIYEGSKRVKRLDYKIESNEGFAKYKIDFVRPGTGDYSFLIEDNTLYLVELNVSDGYMYAFTKK